jgi:diaminopimelate decarboxylase
LIKKVPGKFPKQICFRYNPGKGRTGNSIIGKPATAKYGVTDGQFLGVYRMALARGADPNQCGFHTMVCSNERRCGYFVDTIKMSLAKVALLYTELGIKAPFINIGGGFGIPYQPGQKDLNVELIGQRATVLFKAFEKKYGFMPKLYTECGRFMTGPNGVIMCRIINRKDIYETYLQVDSGMPDLMRPAIYGAYHHIHVLNPQGGLRQGGRLKRMAVSGSICENCDRFTASDPAPNRLLPVSASVGDLVVVHDTGAHGIAMGFNYNGRKRSQELLLCSDGSVARIGRAQTDDDLVRTYKFPPKHVSAIELMPHVH